MTDSPYNGPQSGGTLAECCDIKSPTARQQLVEKQSRLTKQLDDVKEAIQALDDNPEIERVLTLVGRTVRF